MSIFLRLAALYENTIGSTTLWIRISNVQQQFHKISNLSIFNCKGGLVKETLLCNSQHTAKLEFSFPSLCFTFLISSACLWITGSQLSQCTSEQFCISFVWLRGVSQTKMIRKLLTNKLTILQIYGSSVVIITKA